jgi:peroxiredoxin
MKNLIKISLLLFTLGIFMTSCGEATEAANTAADTVIDATAETTEVIKDGASKMMNDEISKGLKIGDAAEDFNLKNVNGDLVSLSSIEGAKGYIVTFTCNTCPYAVEYEDRIIALHKKYAPMGYPVIAINPNDPEVKEGDSFKAMQVRAEEKSFPFEYVFDEGQKVFPAFGATKTPHVFLLNKELVVKYIGAIDDNHEDVNLVKVKYVEDAISALEAGNDPDPATTKAIGCGIKSKKKMM